MLIKNFENYVDFDVTNMNAIPDATSLRKNAAKDTGNVTNRRYHYLSVKHRILSVFVNFRLINSTRTVRGSDYSPAIKLSEQKDKLVTATGDTENYSEKQANKVWFNFVYWLSLSRNEILTSIKGCNSVANLQNLTLYNSNLDIIDVNVYTKFG